MATAIVNRLTAEGKPLPNICLYDWSQMADPTFFKTGGEVAGQNQSIFFVADDFAVIRPYGIAHGLVLSDWIRQQIGLGYINTNKPVQMVGHSAGGFVVGECAFSLKNQIATNQVTMLDTPFPIFDVEANFPKPGNVERYITSEFGDLGNYSAYYIRDSLLKRGATPFYYKTPESSGRTIYEGLYSPRLSTGAHCYAHEWYSGTIANSAIANGFYYSPWLGHGFHDLVSGASLRSPNGATGTNSDMAIDGFTAFGNVTYSNAIYTLTEAMDAGIYKTIAMPVGAESLKFRYRFVSAGDGDFLSVHWGTNVVLFVGPDLPISRSSFIYADVPVTDYAGQTNDLVFKLVSRGETNAVVAVDQIVIVVNSDADGDGLSNDQEQTLGTNPLCYDTDDDGLSDGDEVNIYATNPRLRDTDGDGVSDGQELAAGTNPNSAASVFNITSVQRNPNGTVTC